MESKSYSKAKCGQPVAKGCKPLDQFFKKTTTATTSFIVDSDDEQDHNNDEDISGSGVSLRVPKRRLPRIAEGEEDDDYETQGIKRARTSTPPVATQSTKIRKHSNLQATNTVEGRNSTSGRLAKVGGSATGGIKSNSNKSDHTKRAFNDENRNEDSFNEGPSKAKSDEGNFEKKILQALVRTELSEEDLEELKDISGNDTQRAVNMFFDRKKLR